MDDLGGAFAMEMHAHLCENPHHRDEHGSTSTERVVGFPEADRKKGIRTSAASRRLWRGKRDGKRA